MLAPRIREHISMPSFNVQFVLLELPLGIATEYGFTVGYYRNRFIYIKHRILFP